MNAPSLKYAAFVDRFIQEPNRGCWLWLGMILSMLIRLRHTAAKTY